MFSFSMGHRTSSTPIRLAVQNIAVSRPYMFEGISFKSIVKHALCVPPIHTYIHTYIQVLSQDPSYLSFGQVVS